MLIKNFWRLLAIDLRLQEQRDVKNIGNRNINEVSFGRKNDKYLRGREYLINILLLSECDCLVAGWCGWHIWSAANWKRI